jgi:hypothetical protein
MTFKRPNCTSARQPVALQSKPFCKHVFPLEIKFKKKQVLTKVPPHHDNDDVNQ